VTLVVDDGRLRASDADREKTVALLREHHAVGRLTAEEFNDRLEQVYQARTLGELDTLLADLPAIDLYQLPSASIRPGPSPRRSVRRREGPGAHLDRSADNSVAWTAQVARWTGLGVVSMLVWLGLAVAAGGLAWIPWFLLIVIPVAVALGRHRPRPLSRPAVIAPDRYRSCGAGHGPVRYPGRGSMPMLRSRPAEEPLPAEYDPWCRRYAVGSRSRDGCSRLCCGPSAGFPSGSVLTE
jgi:hypothetical protein